MVRNMVLLAVVAAWVSGCGERDVAAPAAAPAGDPALARKAPAEGEILVRGELSPASHGPYEFDGNYRVAFEQFAPEDAALDFRQQTSFVATLDREAEIEGPGSVRLFKASRRTGTKRVELHGRYFVDVSFGDFPYVVRFTPRR